MATDSTSVRFDRRRFLAGTAAGAGAAIALTALPVGFARRVAAQTGPRSLVCVFLEGGADSANMYIPLDNAVAGRTHSDYSTVRGDFALPRDRIIPIGDGRFGINDSLDEIAALATAGRMATVRNVGPLVQPTTRQDFRAGVSLPQSLFAHDAQQRLWQTSRPTVAFTRGWGGAISAAVNPDAEVSPQFSIRGTTVWLNADGRPYTRLSPTVPIRPLRGFDTAGINDVLALSLDTAAGSANHLERVLADTIGHVIVTTKELQAATANTAANDVGMDDVASLTLGGQLRTVARLILNRQELNMDRQLFFVAMGGWDTHGDQSTRFPVLLDELNRSIGSFQRALDSMGAADSVVTFTASDFGRTLTSNGDGTDHGWGGHAFVFGDGVAAGDYGTMPDYSMVDNADDTGDHAGNFGGRWIPTTSVAQYGATLARWMGLSDPQLDVAFPELANFSPRDLGFLGDGPGAVEGDLNCDGVADAGDTRALLGHLIGATGALCDPDAADLDGDGSLTLNDARLSAD